MTPLLADIDWGTLLGAAAGAMVMVLTALGGGVKILLSHLSKRAEEQRAHELSIMNRVDAIVAKFDQTTREQATAQRQESRETIGTLLKIQGETVEAVGKLSQRVGELGLAINELRSEVSRKADREDAAQSKRPRAGG